MIVCSCNVFTDHDVRRAVQSGPEAPRRAGEVYGCLGCSAQCGRCARTIRRIMDEALGAADAVATGGACTVGCGGCPHGAQASAHGAPSAHGAHASDAEA
jgi:bacterioferritin-associated ferredoxin